MAYQLQRAPNPTRKPCTSAWPYLLILSLAALSACAKTRPTPATSRNPMPFGTVSLPPSTERQRVLADLDPVWVNRTRIANMLNGKYCYFQVRIGGATGPLTRANARPVFIRLGDRSGSQGPDADRDGVSDVTERTIGTNPNNADTDGDTIPDGFEIFGSGTSPLKADSNGNGMPDNVEFPLDDPNAYADSDGDGLLNGQEIAHYHTNPNSLNSDGDMVNDDEEILLGTDPDTADTDSDGDGEPDAFEIANGTDPMSRQSELTDTDNDNVPDFLDPDNVEIAMVRSRQQHAIAANSVDCLPVANPPPTVRP